MVPFETAVGVDSGVEVGDVTGGGVVLLSRGISHSSFWFLMHVMRILLCFIILTWNLLKIAM